MTAATEPQLRQLREGDRLTYHGVPWRVDDYSTYADTDDGYETEEWLLKSRTGKEYYLMREINPEGANQRVQWYLAEEVRSPSIFDPESAQDVTLQLREDVQSGRRPYPQLRMYNRTYKFESETEGNYESEDETCDRITWDYWDEAHLWNLALEAWSDGTLKVYSTRTVQPQDFTNVQIGQADFAPIDSKPTLYKSQQTTSSQTWQFVAAWILVFVGIIFIFAGI